MISRTPFTLVVCAGLLAFLFGDVSGGRQAAKRLVVGTKETAPFAMKDDQGNWHGISIELWKEIAAELKMEYQFQELSLEDLLLGVRDGRLDAAVAAFTINAERERFIDFSHPYFLSGLGIAVPARGTHSWMGTVKGLFSAGFMKVVLVLALVLFLVGFVVWLFERKRNPEQFGGRLVEGLGSAFWWSAVTMTTVGYGDKAPMTPGGRLIGLVWMFAGIIMISSFTAAITSQLTINQLETGIKGPNDLPNARVATVSGSTSAAYLQSRGIRAWMFASTDACLEALVQGRADAAVYDLPILKYLVNTQFQGQISVLQHTFEPQYYGIALPVASPLRERLNRTLLSTIEEPGWTEIVQRYLGE